MKVDPEQMPVIHAPQKIPIAIHDLVKEELQRVEADNIVAKVTEPTS